VFVGCEWDWGRVEGRYLSEDTGLAGLVLCYFVDGMFSAGFALAVGTAGLWNVDYGLAMDSVSGKSTHGDERLVGRWLRSMINCCSLRGVTALITLIRRTLNSNARISDHQASDAPPDRRRRHCPRSTHKRLAAPLHTTIILYFQNQCWCSFYVIATCTAADRRGHLIERDFALLRSLVLFHVSVSLT